MSKPKKPFLPIDPKFGKQREMLIDLPEHLYTGIGKVIQAHAILENTISETLYDLMKIEAPEGRLAFKYRAASVQFDLIIDLLTAFDIKPRVNLLKMKKQIKDCCDARDELAHGIWLDAEGKPGIRLIDGFYETPEGKRSRAVLPEVVGHSDKFFEKAREVILITVNAVRAMRSDIKAARSA